MIDLHAYKFDSFNTSHLLDLFEFIPFVRKDQIHFLLEVNRKTREYVRDTLLNHQDLGGPNPSLFMVLALKND